MPDRPAVRIGDERFTDESIEVRSPYDGASSAACPKCDAGRRRPGGRAPPRPHATRPLPRVEAGRDPRRRRRLLAERRTSSPASSPREAAKPIKTARVEASGRCGTFQFAAAEARTLDRRDGAARRHRRRRRASSASRCGVPDRRRRRDRPFNFPLNLVAHKLAPAIAAGCPVVLKPASQTPFRAIALAELLIDECGLPPGWLHVVTGGGGTVGNAIVDHPDIALITFTGSPDVGWGIRARAPRKRVGLELGNNAPVIIEPTATGRRRRRRSRSPASATPARAASRPSGSTCTARSPTTFTDALVEHVSTLVVGDPLDEATDVSALIIRGDARPGEVVDRRGRRPAAPRSSSAARSTATACSRPTVLTDATPDMKVCRGEVFGPVVARRRPTTTLDEALALANDTRYGLQAAIFTTDLGERAAGGPHARLRRRARQRGADVARRPAALRRRARQRQHAGGPALRGPGDDRGAPGHPPALTRCPAPGPCPPRTPRSRR